MKTPELLKHIIITEEIPGVPKEEQFFLYFDGEVKYFPTYKEAGKWCEERGYTHNLCRFEP